MPENQRNPERTRETILTAAIEEFAAKGLSGARVDEIAGRSGSNKRMIYHYFGGKEGLYVAVLERIYEDIRKAELSVDLEGVDAIEGMRRMVRFIFGYLRDNPHFVMLLNDENLHGARFVKKSKKIARLQTPLMNMLGRLLEQGRGEGVFRNDVDPRQLYISIAALGYFYFSNQATLSNIFGRDLRAEDALAERQQHAIDVILGYLRP
ncbi:MAG: TetR family transcriptional regulator [Rhodospirillales bacterium]|nr:TetR family transcriptional regulator [Rhodospirillales bacterium]